MDPVPVETEAQTAAASHANASSDTAQPVAVPSTAAAASSQPSTTQAANGDEETLVLWNTGGSSGSLKIDYDNLGKGSRPCTIPDHTLCVPKRIQSTGPYQISYKVIVSRGNEGVEIGKQTIEKRISNPKTVRFAMLPETLQLAVPDGSRRMPCKKSAFRLLVEVKNEKGDVAEEEFPFSLQNKRSRRDRKRPSSIAGTPSKVAKLSVQHLTASEMVMAGQASSSGQSDGQAAVGNFSLSFVAPSGTGNALEHGALRVGMYLPANGKLLNASGIDGYDLYYQPILVPNRPIVTDNAKQTLRSFSNPTTESGASSDTSPLGRLPSISAGGQSSGLLDVVGQAAGSGTAGAPSSTGAAPTAVAAPDASGADGEAMNAARVLRGLSRLGTGHLLSSFDALMNHNPNAICVQNDNVAAPVQFSDSDPLVEVPAQPASSSQ